MMNLLSPIALNLINRALKLVLYTILIIAKYWYGIINGMNVTTFNRQARSIDSYAVKTAADSVKYDNASIGLQDL